MRPSATGATHCGSCDAPCLAGATSSGGTCQCPLGRSDCDSLCADLMNDRSHGGSCGAACLGSDACVMGHCESCPVGATACGEDRVDTLDALGTWDLDVRTGSLYSPSEYLDIMGYCMPPWISDCTFQVTLDRVAILNGCTALRLLFHADPTAAWRLLLVEPERVRRGTTYREARSTATRSDADPTSVPME